MPQPTISEIHRGFGESRNRSRRTSPRVRVRRAAATTVSALGLAVLGACSAGSPGAPTASDLSSCAPHDPAQTTTGAEHNLVDVTFLRGMLPYHAQAVAMSSQVWSRALSPEVKGVADRIDRREEGEIDQINGMLITWREPRPQPGGPGIEGMPSNEQTAQLATFAGPAFDRLFLQMMIAHHRAAIPPAHNELDRGINREAKALACNVITAQQDETAQMYVLLRRI